MKILKLMMFFFLLVLSGACQIGAEFIPLESPERTQEPPSATETSSPTINPTDKDEKEFATLRARMVAEQIEPRGINDQAVLIAMHSVPRHKFVPGDMRDLAYADHPLPIGYGQTISQPFIVALMTQSLQPFPGQRVLEIGTGSGYQAAVLGALGVEVYTVEIIPELAKQAALRLDSLGYTNIHTLNADGYFGWEEFAPFDAILVTAAPDHLPQPLVNQLVEGGRLVIPIGPVGFLQTMWLFEKSAGELQATNLGGVTFVPLTGEH
ncbi:MAG TPA: protein-L-isoaspartate(D-aspartate) O-methyltransferase [Anaerolineales bacterium]|nr:protein-L-isoaspartate(D-aspartate) O-methyltransferase [Anaerolineales bacterium]